MHTMSVLAIGAHPDDIEFGCAGTLVKYARQGHRVFLLVMTEGDQGGEGRVRKTEQMDAGGLIGAQDVFWGGYADTSIPLGKEPIERIEAVIKAVRPDFILCHHLDDTHQDHRHLTSATISATRYVRNVLFYEGPTTQNFSPQVFVNITDTLEQKIKVLGAHRSQVMKTNIQDLSIVEIAKSTATFRGIQGRVKHAEAFSALRLFINI